MKPHKRSFLSPTNPNKLNIPQCISLNYIIHEVLQVISRSIKTLDYCTIIIKNNIIYFIIFINKNKMLYIYKIYLNEISLAV